jgi:hypothetical protein
MNEPERAFDDTQLDAGCPDSSPAGTSQTIGRPSKCEPFRPLVLEALANEPELPSLELLRRLRLAGYVGGKSAMYAFIAALRRGAPLSPVPPVCLPGERTRHELGQAIVTFAEGRTARILFLVSRLEHSRWTALTVVPDARTETLFRAVVDHFSTFGGLPLLACFEGRARRMGGANPRFATGDGMEAFQWNPQLTQAMLELGVGIEVRRLEPGRGGFAEFLRTSFFNARRFSGEDDLRAQVRDWVLELNDAPRSGCTPSARLEEERTALRPLPVTAAHLALRHPVVVDHNGHVLFEGNRLPMPRGAAGLPGTLFLYADRIKVVAGTFEATYPRDPATPSP